MATISALLMRLLGGLSALLWTNPRLSLLSKSGDKDHLK